MPLYDYQCDTCGPFRAWNSMSRARDPEPCPACGGAGRRTVSTPFLATMDPHRRIAHQRNEKAAHEPTVMTRQELDSSGVKRGHARGHRGHAHHDHPAPAQDDRPRMHQSKWRWMIGH